MSDYFIRCILCDSEGYFDTDEDHQIGEIVKDSECNTCGAEGVIVEVLDDQQFLSQLL